MSTDAQVNAIKTYLASQTKAPVYKQREAQALAATALPSSFTTIKVEPIVSGEPRLDGSRPTPARRLVTRVAARTDANLSLIEDRIADAFEFTTVDLGDTITAFTFDGVGADPQESEGFIFRDTYWRFGV